LPFSSRYITIGALLIDAEANIWNNNVKRVTDTKLAARAHLADGNFGNLSERAYQRAAQD